MYGLVGVMMLSYAMYIEVLTGDPLEVTSVTAAPALQVSQYNIMLSQL